MCPVVSGPETLAADPLGPVGCRVGVLVLAHPTDAQLHWDVGIFRGRVNAFGSLSYFSAIYERAIENLNIMNNI